MVGTAPHGQLNAGVRVRDPRNRSRVRFAVATSADDAAIRRLLRENPMRGTVTLTLEREPDYFRATGLGGAEEHTILAFESDRLICMGRCTVRDCWINGRVERIGYLAELRLDASAQGRFGVLRDGYRFFRELQGANPPALCFTSIAADNQRARRLLERGVPGLPRYSFLCEFVTFVISAGRRRTQDVEAGRSVAAEPSRSSPASVPEFSHRATTTDSDGSPRVPANHETAELLAFLNACAGRSNLGTAWSEAQLSGLASHGLPFESFRVIRVDGRIVASAALWDQRSFRQIVIRHYAPALRWARPALNLLLPRFGRPRLPAPGSVLPHAFVAPLALAAGYEHLLPALISRLRRDAAARGLEYLTLGFAAGDRRCAIVRNHFRGRVYRSRLYRVAWPGDAEWMLDGRTFSPDVSFL